VLAAQIVLGGWVSTNYAGLACNEFPTCQTGWLPTMDFTNAFHLLRELGQTPEGELLGLPALTAIHWTHRVGALVATAVTGGLALRLLALPAFRLTGSTLLGLLVLQVLLGVANVQFHLPLPLAVGHNAVAALLLVTLVTINYRLHHPRA
jgi:cytochrome c oxidase assembly protein subunit 15